MTINTGINEVHLRFNSVNEKKEWITAILDCQKKLI